MSAQSVKILSGWSNPGGTTMHHIALTNLLNEAGYDCTFYGRHAWHLGRCRSGRLDDARVDSSDIVISHFVNMPKLNCRLHVLSCHETDLFPLKSRSLEPYDVIQFVSDFQRCWHGVDHPWVVIPPVVDRIRWNNPRNHTAAVIGSIDRNKQTHLAIAQALADGYRRILLFGVATDRNYFEQEVRKYVENGSAVLMGHEDQRERMYGLVEVVYHSSLRETFGLVEAECSASGIPFVGPRNNPQVLDKAEILGRWQQLFR